MKVLYWLVILGGILVTLILAFSGFIFLFEASINYEPISKIIQIYKNTNVNGCITTLQNSGGDDLRIYTGTKDSIIFITFTAFLFLFLYSLLVLGCVILWFIYPFK